MFSFFLLSCLLASREPDIGFSEGGDTGSDSGGGGSDLEGNLISNGGAGGRARGRRRGKAIDIYPSTDTNLARVHPRRAAAGVRETYD